MICSTVWPVCSAVIFASSCFHLLKTWAWMAMSDAVPVTPADGWCLRMRAYGSAYRLPGVPDESRKCPIDAARHIAYVATSGSIVSIGTYLATPAVTDPPGELM